MESCEGVDVPALGDRLALRLAGGSASRGDASGPQVASEAGLELGDGLKVGPDLSLQDRGDRRVIDASKRFRGAKAAAIHGGEDVDRQNAGSFDGGVSAGVLRPVLHEVCRDLANGSAHDQSLGNGLYSRVSSSTEFPKAQPAPPVESHTVGSNHQRCGDAVARAIADYKPDIPDDDWTIVGPFVRDAVTDCDAKTPYGARELLATLARHVWWCWRSAGLELERATVFRREVIGEYIARGCSQMSPASAGNRRSQLLRMSEILLPPQAQVSRLAPMPPSAALEPYAPHEITTLKSWACGLNTQYRCEQAHILLALGLGAGLSNAEILAVQSRHIRVDDDGVLVEVTGRRPRVVPLLAAWEQVLIDYSRARPLNSEQFVFRPRRTSQDSNSIGNFVDRTRPGSVKATAQRMRVTWIVTHLAAGTPLKPLIVAAGVDSLEALTRYLKFIPGKELADVRAQFRSATAGTQLS